MKCNVFRRQTLRRFPHGLHKRLFFFFPALFLALALFAPPAFAAGGNAITESSIFAGLQKMLQDAGVALMILAPVLGALLIGLFSLLGTLNTEEHDKIKWSKCRKNTLIAMIIVLSSGGIMALVATYFKG